MELEGEIGMGKAWKIFELVTKTRDLWFYLKGSTLYDHSTHNTFNTVVWESYYDGKQHKVLTLTKPDANKDHAFLTLASKEAKYLISKHGLVYNHDMLKVSETHYWDIGNPSKLCISMTLVFNNLPQKESQPTIVKTIKKLFGEDNIVEVSFRCTLKHKVNQQSKWCHMQCLNTVVYTGWLNKFVYILGMHVDFIP